MKSAHFLRMSLWIFSVLISSTMALGQQIAFTWDDVPAHSSLPPGETRVDIERKLVAAMKDAELPPVYGFVNGIQTEKEPLSIPVLKEWQDAGFHLGNHSWSHMNLNQSSLANWEADVVQDETLLKSVAQGDWHWLRFPNLAEGGDPQKRLEARKFLAERGYKIAAVTMSFGDYMFNDPYARCVAKKDTAAMARLETTYLTSAEAAIDYSRTMSKALYGRDIPYVLLMHIGALDAKMLPQLIKLYQTKGFTFVRLEDAEKDPFYKNDIDLSLPPAPDTLEEAMRIRNLPIPASPHPKLDVNSLCR